MLVPKHIFLTGFMGSGKSTLGKKLAALLRRPFIDLDTLIEKKEGKSISELFEQQGESAFRQKETEALQELIHHQGPLVVALGGGAICFHNNLQLVKDKGLLIYLELPPAALADRIRRSRKERPLLKGLAGPELAETIEKKMEQREQFYRQAHLTVSGVNLTAQLLQQAIIDAE